MIITDVKVEQYPSNIMAFWFEHGRDSESWAKIDVDGLKGELTKSEWEDDLINNQNIPKCVAEQVISLLSFGGYFLEN